MMALRLMFAILAMLWQSDPAGGDPPDGDDGDTGDPPGNKGGADDTKTFSQADVDRIVTSRLTREKETLRSSLRDEIKAELDDDRKKEDLKQKEEYKPLYEESQREVERLKAVETDVTRMTTALEAVYASQLEDLPESTRKIADGLEKKFDVIERLEWITQLPDEFKKPRVKGIPDTHSRDGDDPKETPAESYISSTYGKLLKRS